MIKVNGNPHNLMENLMLNSKQLTEMLETSSGLTHLRLITIMTTGLNALRITVTGLHKEVQPENSSALEVLNS
jgi:hypothetical protein